jgi:hypothetical protein
LHDATVQNDAATDLTQTAGDPPNIRHSRVRQIRLTWSRSLAYAIGLVATDGCLLRTGRHVAFVSKDLDQIHTFLRCIDRVDATVRKDGGAYRIFFGDVELYDWLKAVGLTPKKSLTMRGLRVPDEFFLDAVRGLFDGDGSIAHYVHVPNLAEYPNYRYRRLCVRFYSASEEHLNWLRKQLRAALGIRGALLRQPRQPKHDLFALQYSKRASTTLLARLYEDPESPRLLRHWLIWEEFKAQPVTTRPYQRRKPFTD